MGFWSANKSTVLLKNALGFVSNGIFRTPVSRGPILQVRTATKRAAGSRTNMKDSAGRKLGAKKGEGELVRPGQIIMRQRGTKFYPGENVGIGKDHTIFALEPGFVRFYLDPFHPRRRFIGIALSKDARLPTPHFEPRARRLGYVPIEDPVKAKLEERSLKRKQFLMKPILKKEVQARDEKKRELLNLYGSQLTKVAADITKENISLATDRLLTVRNHIENGLSPQSAKATTTMIYIYNQKLLLKKKLVSAEDFDASKRKYLQLSETLEKTVSFDNKFNLIPYRSEEDRKSIVLELESKIKELYNKFDKKCTAEIESLILNSDVLKSREALKLKRAYVKSVLPESFGVTTSKEKGAVISKRWNYSKGRVEVISRTKEAFATRK